MGANPHTRVSWPRAAAAALVALAGSCVDPTLPEDDLTPLDDAVTVDTSSALARAQYDLTVAFANGYRPRCTVPPTADAGPRRRRVLVTGFGRFLTNPVNATGMLVNALVPAAQYPSTAAPPPGQTDDPAPQTRVVLSTARLPSVGEVDVCAMILPVLWDLSAVLVLKELEAFGPDLVVMNGIAGPEQALWVELGSVNRAMVLEDGSGLLRPRPPAGQRFAPLVPSAPADALRRGMLLSWSTVRDAAAAAIRARGAEPHQGRRFDAVLQGALFGGYPRDGNTYLCNNVTYLVNHAMANPGRTLTLLQASTARRGVPNRVQVRVTRDLRATPRVFLHWPGALAGRHLTLGAEVLAAALGAQLDALRTGREPPTVGDNTQADLAPSGQTF